MFAAAAMSFSSVSVVTNALRLNRFRPKRIAQDAHNMQYCTVPSDEKDDAQPSVAHDGEQNDAVHPIVCSAQVCSAHIDAAAIGSESHRESDLTAESAVKPETITNKENTRMKNITLTVEGMSCGHCSARVEKALNAIEGVSAKVDLQAKSAAITYPDTVTVDALKAAVTDAGYSVSAVH